MKTQSGVDKCSTRRHQLVTELLFSKTLVCGDVLTLSAGVLSELCQPCVASLPHGKHLKKGHATAPGLPHNSSPKTLCVGGSERIEAKQETTQHWAVRQRFGALYTVVSSKLAFPGSVSILALPIDSLRA